jgi:hypothetical protein
MLVDRQMGAAVLLKLGAGQRHHIGDASLDKRPAAHDNLRRVFGCLPDRLLPRCEKLRAIWRAADPHRHLVKAQPAQHQRPVKHQPADGTTHTEDDLLQPGFADELATQHFRKVSTHSRRRSAEVERGGAL